MITKTSVESLLERLANPECIDMVCEDCGNESLACWECGNTRICNHPIYMHTVLEKMGTPPQRKSLKDGWSPFVDKWSRLALLWNECGIAKSLQEILNGSKFSSHHYVVDPDKHSLLDQDAETRTDTIISISSPEESLFYYLLTLFPNE